MVRLKQVLAFVLTWGILLATSPTGSEAWASVAVHPPVFAMQEAAQANLSASQIDELVSPIALYPDALVAQILAGSTYPDQIVAANSWLQAERYEQMNRWAKEINGNQTLILGAENWPFPIPLKKNAAGTWYFDSKAGVKEILFRRIGKNELAAIRVCRALADAQNEYFGQKQQYAQHVMSDAGQQNGLYWKAAEGEPESPIGPLVAFATAKGYGGEHDTPQPFYGYYFHTLTAQGAAVKGGAKSYIVDGKMTGGFAYIAWPAEYRNSGVMTFLVGTDGVIYEKDLGAKTADLAKAMTAYNPDKTWKPAVSGEDDSE